MPQHSDATSAREVPFRAVAKSLVWVYCLAGIGLLIPLATIPFLSRVLGQDAWGRALCALSIGTLFVVIVEYGFNLSGTRSVAYAVKDRRRHSRAVGDIISAKCICALAVVVLGSLTYFVMPIFHGHALVLAMAVLWGIVGGWNLGWYFQGTRRPALSLTIETVARLLGAAVTFFLIDEPNDDWVVLAINAGVSAFVLLVTFPLVVSEVGWPRLSVSGGWTQLKESRSLASYVLLAGFRNSGNRVVLGFLSSPITVATFGNAERLVELMIRAMDPASRVIYPLLCEKAAHSHVGARQTFFRAAATLGSLALVSALSVFVLAGPIVRLMCGPGYEESATILRVLVALPVLKAASMIFNTFWAQPHGLDRHMFPGVAFAGCMTLALAGWMVPHYGALGMAVAAVVSESTFLSWSIGFLIWSGRSPFTWFDRRSMQLANSNSDGVTQAAHISPSSGDRGNVLPVPSTELST